MNTLEKALGPFPNFHPLIIYLDLEKEGDITQFPMIIDDYELGNSKKSLLVLDRRKEDKKYRCAIIGDHPNKRVIQELAFWRGAVEPAAILQRLYSEEGQIAVALKEVPPDYIENAKFAYYAILAFKKGLTSSDIFFAVRRN